MSPTWTEESKAEIIEAYKDASPTPETTVEIINDLSTDFERPVNSIRAMLVKAEVYISKKNTPSTSDSGDKPPRKSKQDSLDELSALLTANELTADDAIISKLTGKAAEYFIGTHKQALHTVPAEE